MHYRSLQEALNDAAIFKNLDIDKLKVFYTLAKVANFQAAGQLLNVSQASVSKNISNVEEVLQVRLINRHKGKTEQFLTPAGRLVFQAVEKAFRALLDAEQAIRYDLDHLFGRITISSLEGFANFWLLPKLAEFRTLYPNIQITLLTHSNLSTVLTTEADFYITDRGSFRKSLKIEFMRRFHAAFFASKDYLKAFGTPQTLADLQAHSLISHIDTRSNLGQIIWTSKIQPQFNFEKDATICVSSVYALAECIRQGMGVGVLMEYVLENDPNVEHLLKQEALGSLELCLMYEPNILSVKRYAIFVEFIKSLFDKSAR